MSQLAHMNGLPVPARRRMSNLQLRAVVTDQGGARALASAIAFDHRDAG